jgi:DNA-binding XRE family transcriptional regulator
MSNVIQHNGKLWVFDRATETRLFFKPAPMGMQSGMGNYLKQWRKRQKLNQTETGKMFGVTQSSIARIEKGQRPLPMEIFNRIRKDNTANYGR